MTRAAELSAAELRAIVERALFEGANPRGFTGRVREAYEEKLAEEKDKDE